MAASYPGTIKTFSTKASGEAIASSHINDLQDEVKEVETQLVTSKLATLTSAPAANNVLTTDESGAPTWATKAPDADKLDGLDSTNFQHREGWTPVIGWKIYQTNFVNNVTGAQTRHSVGDKVVLTNDGVTKYFYIGSAPTGDSLKLVGDTTVGATGTDLTNIYYSHDASPQGFPQWFDYTPTLSVSGGTAPTYTSGFVNRFCMVGKLVTIYGSWYNVSGGIAGAGENPLLTSLPIAAATNALDVQIGTGAASLGAASSVIGVYLYDSTHVSFTTLDWGNVTGSDQNAIDRTLTFTMMYEAA